MPEPGEGYSPVERIPNRNSMTRLVGGVEASWSAFLGKNTFLFDPDNHHFSSLYKRTDNPSVLSLLVKHEYGGEDGKADVTKDCAERWGKVPEKERADLLLLYKAAYASGWEDQPTSKDLHSTQVLMDAVKYLAGSEMDEATKWDVMSGLLVEKQGGMWDAQRKPVWEAEKQKSEAK